ncbi:MAG: CheY-like chemotaxis protein [Crocinitomicaceae bacterium]|jgi:CheY-like chemotaxis protein
MMKIMKLAVFFMGFLIPAFCLALPQQQISSDDLDQGTVALDGLWAFDWQQLHTDMNKPMQDGLQLPGLWHKQGPYSEFGFATLRLKILMPETAPYYLRIPDMPSAVSLWVNGELFYRRGSVSDQLDLEQPKFGPDVVSLPPSKSYDLILHISNFHHKEGGIWHSLLIANQYHRHELQDQSKIIDAMVFAFLTLVSIYLLIISAFGRGHISYVMFAAFVLVVAMRSIMVGERIAYDFFPNLNWELLQRIEHILLFMSLSFFVYFYQFFFRLKKLYFSHVVALLTVGLILVTANVPAKIFTQFAGLSQVMVFLSVAYVLLSLALLIKQKQRYAILFTISFVGAVLCVIHDYLYTNQWIQSRPLIQFGLVFFVALQVFILWVHRKDDERLLMFVQASIDRTGEDLKAKYINNDFFTEYSISSLVASLKNYSSVLNFTIKINGDDCLVEVDRKKLQNSLLIIARMAERDGVSASLNIDMKNTEIIFETVLSKPIHHKSMFSEDLNGVHQLLNDMGSSLNIERLVKATVFKFTIPIFNAAEDTKKLQDKFYGSEWAPAILCSKPISSMVKNTLLENYYVVNTSITSANIKKYQPKVIIWDVKNWDVYLLEDIQFILKQFPSIPVLLIVEHYYKAQLAQSIRFGIADYIVSPVLPEELLLKVQRVQALPQSSPAEKLKQQPQDIREVTVNLVRNSIELWKKSSGKSKVDLAENSGLWTVYLDGSTAKTRTLDKYLTLQTLPKKPRWETVARTVNYVLEECELNEQDKVALIKQLDLFNRLQAS